MIIQNALELIGNTPTIQIDGTNIYVKLEKFNFGGSIKDRAALGMIEDAERKGFLKPGSVIIEPTSGNTGIGLALIGRLKGYEVIIVMPDTMSSERRRMVEACGARLILTDGSKGMKGAIDFASTLVSSHSQYFMPNQFSNDANWQIHYRTTAVEILRDLPNIDIFVSGVGTGGSFTGISKKLKQIREQILCIAVEPSKSPVLSGGKAGPHSIQGIGAGFVPGIFSYENLDEVIAVHDEDAENEAITFSKETGILVGLSTGANILAAKRAAEKYGQDKIILTLSPDGGEKYLSLGIY
ncbi:MAG: cysteine synthase A [Tissierellales bacterium]|nr:cysteine synthase A [Tissierellales bacterium]MBN2827540.1 cysteine synthase A [Tissierellales bacterium]